MNRAVSVAYAVAVADTFAQYTGLLSWMRRRCAGGVTILVYHKILPEQAVAAYPMRHLVVDKALFRLQMAWLSEYFEVVTLREAMEIFDRGFEGRNRARRPLACVTFDDGYRDNFDHAAPILEAHGMRGTFFIATGFINGEPLWFDRAAWTWSRKAAAAAGMASSMTSGAHHAISEVKNVHEWVQMLKKMPAHQRQLILDGIDSSRPEPEEVFGPMTPEQIRELADRGHEIGSHTVTHPILPLLDAATLHFELERSRLDVCQWTGREPPGFCYPNGDYDERVVAAVRAAGYSYGCATHRGMVTCNDEPMALPRRMIHQSGQQAMSAFAAEVVGWHEWLRQRRKDRPAPHVPPA